MSAEDGLRQLAGGAATLGELFETRRESTRDPIRLVTDFKSGFVERGANVLWSRREQFDAASLAAGTLAEAGVGRGDRVVLLLPSARDFVTVFFACQMLGAVPVPLVPPWSMSRIDAHLERIGAVCRVCTPRATVLDPDTFAALSAFSSADLKEKRFGRLISRADLTRGPMWSEASAAVSPEAPAFIQFTSGSTAAPRGVLLSHRALLENAYAIGTSLKFEREGHVGCSWLPLFHDMGLIGHVLVPLLWQIPNVALPPESFALRPESWLEAVSGYRATISTAPNFAYQLAAKRMRDDFVGTLDLSRWEVAMCGGEPVLAATLSAFTERFAGAGFRRTALCPVYGLAEFSLAMTLSHPDGPPMIEVIARDEFAESGVARVVEAGQSSGSQDFEVVSSGRVPPRHEIKIIGEDGAILPDGVEGRILGKGPSMMSGYLNDPENTDRTIEDGWLVTGDRGYLRAGNLFVTGRSKEVIIKGGRNLYPQEVEAAAGSVEGVRAGRVVAFAVFDDSAGTDELVVLCETHDDDESRRLDIERKVLGAVTAHVGVRPDRVVMLAPGTLTKTSSGKLQRVAAKQRYLEDRLDAPEGTKMKWAKLWLVRSAHRLRGIKA